MDDLHQSTVRRVERCTDHTDLLGGSPSYFRHVEGCGGTVLPPSLFARRQVGHCRSNTKLLRRKRSINSLKSMQMGKQRKQTKNPVRDKIEGMYVPGERKDDT